MNMLELIGLIVLLWINIGTIITLIGAAGLDLITYYEHKYYIEHIVPPEERGNYKICDSKTFGMFNGFKAALTVIMEWPIISIVYYRKIQLSWNMLRLCKAFGDYKKRHPEG